MMRKVELLVPASSLEVLKIAVVFGADFFSVFLDLDLAILPPYTDIYADYSTLMIQW